LNLQIPHTAKTKIVVMSRHFQDNLPLEARGYNMLFSFVKAFTAGGLFCAIAQLLIDKTNLTPAKILTAYVVVGVVLGGAGVFKPLLDFAEAGASVPLIGFGNVLAAGVRKAIDERGAIGILTGGLTACAAGIAAAVAFSLLAAFVGKPKEK
jgi:stage V sporulation protein AE